MRTLPVLFLLVSCATTPAVPRRATPPTVRLDAEAGCRVVDERGPGATPLVADKELCKEARGALIGALQNAGYKLVDEGATEIAAKLHTTLVARRDGTTLSVALRLSNGGGEEIEKVLQQTDVGASVKAAVDTVARAVAGEMKGSPRLREAGLVPG